MDYCSSQPCQNGGTCRNSVDSATCLCTMEYTGQYCQGIDILLNLQIEVMKREGDVSCKKIVNMKVCLIFSPKFQMNRLGYRYGLLQIGKPYVLFITSL